MPPPQGLVKVSRAAADRNLKGDISNGSYGTDWYSERGGSQVNEGGWASGDDTWMRPDLAAQFEGLSQPAPAGAPSDGAAPGGGVGGGAMSMPMPMPMAGPGIDVGNSTYNRSGPASTNPALGKRNPAIQGLTLAMQPRNY